MHKALSIRKDWWNRRAKMYSMMQKNGGSGGTGEGAGLLRRINRKSPSPVTVSRIEASEAQLSLRDEIPRNLTDINSAEANVSVSSIPHRSQPAHSGGVDLPSRLRFFFNSSTRYILLGRTFREMAAAAMQTVRFALATILLAISNAGLSNALDPRVIATTSYMDAKATFYGGNDASGTMNGGCGYANPFSLGYGAQTAALSTPLWNKGLTCGACFQIRCKISASAYAKQWCYASAPSIVVTATNMCPPGSYGGWCDPPKLHFDLAYAAFTRLANQAAGVIPIQYRRTPCRKSGGIKFTMNGNPYWDLVLAHNVGGGGNIHAMQIKGSRTSFMQMKQNWGQNWDAYANLVGQAITFKVTLGNGRTVTYWNVVGSGWKFGQTWQAKYNF